MRSLRPLLVLVLVLGLAVMPVAAEEVDVEACRPVIDTEGQETGQELCTSQQWFTESTGKVGNVEGLSQIEGESTTGFPSWDTTEPAAVTTGAGGGYYGSPVVDIAFEKDPAAGVTFAGELGGNIDALAFDLYLFMPEANLPVSTREHGLRMEILSGAGVPVVSHGEAQLVDLEPAGNALFRARFAVSGLYDVAGLRADNDAVRDLRINVTPFFFLHDSVYVYDAAEAPASMIVNPTADQLADFALLPRF